MRTVVPCQRGDAVAGLDAEIEQRAGEAAGADGEVAVGVAADGLVGGAPHDLVARIDRFGAAEDGRQRERVVHHQAVHGISLGIRD